MLRFSAMLLILGDSYAHWACLSCTLGPHMEARGWRGARLADEDFRRWAIDLTNRRQPQDVLLIVGGNDAAYRQFSPRIISQLFQELILGLYAAGAQFVHVLPIPPRSASRPGGVSVAVYRRRRRLINQILQRLATRPQGADAPRFALRSLPLSAGFLGSDGVHPSSSGWRDLETVFNDIASCKAYTLCTLRHGLTPCRPRLFFVSCSYPTMYSVDIYSDI